MKLELDHLFIIFISIVLIIIIAILVTILVDNHICKENGYDRSEIFLPSEQGYITCVKNIYNSEHVFLEHYYKGVKK